MMLVSQCKSSGGVMMIRRSGLVTILGALGVAFLLVFVSGRCLTAAETRAKTSESVAGSTQDLSIVEAMQASMVALADARVRAMTDEGRYRVVRVEPRDSVGMNSAQPNSRLALVVLADGGEDRCVGAVVDLASMAVISAALDIGHYGLGPWERVRAVELALQDDGVREQLGDHPCRIGSVYDSSYSKASSCNSGRCAGVLIHTEKAGSSMAVLAVVDLKEERVVSVDTWPQS